MIAGWVASTIAGCNLPLGVYKYCVGIGTASIYP